MSPARSVAANNLPSHSYIIHIEWICITDYSWLLLFYTVRGMGFVKCCRENLFAATSTGISVNNRPFPHFFYIPARFPQHLLRSHGTYAASVGSPSSSYMCSYLASIWHHLLIWQRSLLTIVGFPSANKFLGSHQFAHVIERRFWQLSVA